MTHLRAGGSTPWAQWWRAPGAAGDQWAGPVPGAVQLELVRRLAAARPPGCPDAAFTALADRALSRSGPGRGLPDLPLLVPGTDAGTPADHLFGAPPTDPGDVPVDELLRLGVGLLADLVMAAGPLPAPTLPRRPLMSRHRFHLAGAPVTVDAIRTALAADGVVEGGWSPEVLLVARPLDVHLAELWSTRVQHGAPVRWSTFAGRWARRDALPPSADLPGIAQWWARKVGPSRVHVLVGPGLPEVARVLGLRRTPAPMRSGYDVRPLSPASTDLLRRLNRVLNVRARDEERAGLLRRARDLLPAAPATPLALPPRWRPWADRRAGEVAAAVRAGGYRVHGDLDGIASRHLGAAGPREADVLTSVLEACLLLAAGGSTPGAGVEEGTTA